ncbi:molybdate ABC transporter substrate-binding protein [Nocardiopsis sp. N85]|uniref:molybdate ABC transporter substrate-binding protein n=1 Tax=Nocardiopsis sp. N85 TaxID=3029400 RepID=UPI00237F0E37|nr:molybdate ABC transporter substrate-binding protein [Nocardiopsis sp. N85]MDE3724980.1 molybdate ABC transporter substrate-binding protein [Nocardiopsis sp. N85]
MRDAPRRLGAALTAAALALTACGSEDTGPDTDAGVAEGDLTGRLTVFAAASLTDVFEELAEEFEARDPGAEVVFNFAGSGELATQINSGAPADVFAAADTSTMDQVVEGEGLAGEWVAEHGEGGAIFATNTMEIAVPPGNPAGIEDLDDLAADGVSVAFCAEEVPCGTATLTVLEAAGLDVTPVTYEENVRAVLTKVELGEVDAGLVYVTDVDAAGTAVTGISFPEADEVVNDYPIAVPAGAPRPALAAAWIDLVLSETGASVLTGAGFGTP